ncbi:DUF6261 family protein [uncultured Acetobacteroides sp.]|uniref:DUF6261 family protein n=1 Tax=uncultured Acetobacteroides sp. TaxID=1760811 RepID=UPI0029F51173|nr:DUF6261 family protein [uncultured Acetobacteroides sp.]
MVRITSFNLKKLHRRELRSLAMFVTDRVEVLLPGSHIPRAMVEQLQAAGVVFDASTGPDTNPLETKEQHALYALCVASSRELRGLVESALLRRQEDLQRAGRMVLRAIKRRAKNPRRLAIPVGVEAMRQLANDVRESPELAAAVAAIGATEVVERMEQEASACGAYWTKIRDGRAGGISSMEATRRLRSALSRVFRYLNSMADYDAEVCKTIAEINAVAEPFVVTLKSRATIRAKKKKEAEEAPKLADVLQQQPLEDAVPTQVG